MSTVKMSSDTSHEYKLRQYNHYNRMEQIHNDQALAIFKRPVYQQEIQNETVCTKQ